MDEEIYDEWIQYLEMLWERRSAKPKTILELACGTGRAALRLWEKGYEMIGLDISEDMLALAQGKAAAAGADILFLCQDMREFELYGTVDSIICLCDGMNYILDEAELRTVFKLAANYLNPGGVFIFDLNTEHKFQNALGSFGQALEDCAYICETEYDPDERICEYHASFFMKNAGDKYERYEEFHYQKAYTIAATKKNLALAGFSDIEVCERPERIAGGVVLREPAASSERVYFTAVKR
jgi:SAM-dependent methyltransferase